MGAWVIVGFGLALAGATAAADLQTGLSYFKSGKYLEAAGEFQALVDASPDYADGYHLLGACFLKVNKFADAEKSFLKAIELNGDRFEFHFNLANAYRAQNKHDKVVKTLNNAEGLAPADKKAALYEMRGHALAAQKRWAEAIEDLERAVAADPSAATQTQLGKAYFSIGDYAGATTRLRKALSVQQSAGTWELLIESMINVAAAVPDEAGKKAKYGEALAEAEKFQAANPASAGAKYLVGRTALGAGQFPKAVAAFDATIKADPKHCNAIVNLGQTYIASGDMGKALTTLESATKCDPTMHVAWEKIGFVQQKGATNSKDFAAQQRGYEKAIEAYQKARGIKASAALDKAIQDCQANLQISKENQLLANEEAAQEAAIAAEQARLAEEERKRAAWEAKKGD
jgi:tetratricopeptide (TPR) repeat protein